eukprot:CAMPEP_0175807558 /NCGR_PEP_ID=MMETSP0107_2-20121207/1783_1 /TAXON_ID=195067 ORGANISM="Goniomonas pacifica, Strain CCMP1869" /NCGR_SAMPLE_ID=MMETSP0107_2 /ASSEMBLY_ACC=CAM_ASM_000203 /LENGTH=101 /DNA_ID=CAMNT_0017119113 /DNA_START=104 /DNA_END=409 /DNA_ORIENTATION=+
MSGWGCGRSVFHNCDWPHLDRRKKGEEANFPKYRAAMHQPYHLDHSNVCAASAQYPRHLEVLQADDSCDLGRHGGGSWLDLQQPSQISPTKKKNETHNEVQ